MIKIQTAKCRFCPVCDGFGCRGELPGMGGINNSENFILNYKDWQLLKIYTDKGEQIELLDLINNSNNYTGKNLICLLNDKTKRQFTVNKIAASRLRLAPITGAVENLGYPDEKSWYFDIVENLSKLRIPLSIGDGFPDEKFLFGVEALKTNMLKAFVCIKPYKNNKILERVDWSLNVANMIGVDIDASSIATMKGRAKLEKKTYKQLSEIKNYSKHPFALKGVFDKYSLELTKQLKPDVAIISNHGGRVSLPRASTASFLIEYAKEIKPYVGELWVDGGIRYAKDLYLASILGADEVLVGRPFATAFMKGGSEELRKLVESFSLI